MKLGMSVTAVATAAALMAGACAPPSAAAAGDGDKPVLTCTAAQEWTALFDRREQSSRTWLGADGIYTAALNGNDAFSSADSRTKTFFIFSDTLMGTSDGTGKVTGGYAMPSHTSALLAGSAPDPGRLRFVYGKGGDMTVGSSLFGERKWMLDCFVTGGALYIFGFTPSGDWKPENIDLFRIPIRDGEPDYPSYTKTADIRQLWYRTPDDRYLYAYGMGATLNTAAAGAPDPDGYIYIYGYRDAMKEWSRKDLLAARIKETDFPDFSKLRYWDGAGWSDDIEDSAVLLSAVSCEMSVTPVASGPYKGKYIAVYTNNTQGPEMMYAIGDSPVGPFDTPVQFYAAPEHDTPSADGAGTRYTYNAKAHPHLSGDGKLLVSYNCNMRDGQQYSTDYHPRFLWLDLDPAQAPPEDPCPGDLDQDGKTTISDVMEACKILARQPAGVFPTTEELARADLNGDGKVTIEDVMEICKILARQG
ncbi:MAG: DUF4185 domain-containing protein [Clostridiales bacterium]|nr:DUF4185 domain-containing protein [Clostridiales bacterium]